MLKKNDLVNLKITDLTNLGFGVGREGGIVVFVSGTVPEDEVEVKIIKSASSYAVGRVEKFIKKSPLRASDRCDNTACTSCAYKCISYTHELDIKKQNVKEAFVKAGLSEVEVTDVTPSPKTKEYRNKAQYPISKTKDGEYVIGFYAPKSHRVTEARCCPLAPSVFRKILDTVSAFFKKHDLSVYNEQTCEGLLRHIYLRRGEVSGEILLTLVVNGKSIPHSDELVTDITSRYPEVVGILLNVNTKNTNVVLGDGYITLFGRDYIFDTLGGVRLKITAPSFYQVNRAAADLLYAKAKELAAPTKNDVLLDLYCGAGSIGLSMADAAGEVIGIEIVASAVECAKFNAAANGISNAEFYTGDASDTEKLLSRAEISRGERILPDIIVLDPPRAGCDERLLRYVAGLSPKRVVYVSCNPETLARDAAIFKALGYETKEVFAFDLFPCTGHVESVVCLERRRK
ncbi:MAG: 23S rRNA (uracil(1939)-C(5))-methyltransferase RlmD [Clostridia bacterium]|nr:23S rRNA (uracil(1939)-C(5))-methyltransferase RlmD [Clostridia bacterium]